MFTCYSKGLKSGYSVLVFFLVGINCEVCSIRTFIITLAFQLQCTGT